MKVTELYYLTENLRYILLSEHMYFPAISPFLSDWVTYGSYCPGNNYHTVPVNSLKCGFPGDISCSYILYLLTYLLINFTNVYSGP